MNIENVEYFRLDLNLKAPYKIAYETVDEACNFILKITTTDGLSGYGCAAPDMVVTGEKPSMVEQALENVVIPTLEEKNPYHRGEIMDQLKTLIPKKKSTLCMVNMALYDLLARRAKLPLYQVLGGYRTSIPTSVTIGILPERETLEEAKRILDLGFTILKIKGGLNLQEDLQKLHRLRNVVGRGVKIRFDANQGYSPKETMQFIKDAAKLQIEILEQPVAVGIDLSENEYYKDNDIPIMADESLKHLRDAFRIAKNSAIDMINIKLQKVGGLDEAMHINSVSKSVGNEVMVGCLDECSLGISAGLHFALSRPNVKYADLDAHMDFTNDPFRDLFKIRGGIMYPKLSAGLGTITEEIQEMF